MTTLTNQITIAAPRGAVWQALTDLDLLGQYDPGVRSCQLVGEQASGLGIKGFLHGLQQHVQAQHAAPTPE